MPKYEVIYKETLQYREIIEAWDEEDAGMKISYLHPSENGIGSDIEVLDSELVYLREIKD